MTSHRKKEPALQNIPIRTELGRELRGAFNPGMVTTAGYSKVEERLWAQLQKEDSMFWNDEAKENLEKLTERAAAQPDDTELAWAVEVLSLIGKEMERGYPGRGCLYGLPTSTPDRWPRSLWEDMEAHRQRLALLQIQHIVRDELDKCAKWVEEAATRPEVRVKKWIGKQIKMLESIRGIIEKERDERSAKKR
jgi:hypothetical protein